MSRSTSRQSGIAQVADWMKASGRQPFPFQRKVWKACLAGQSGILHSPTGTGKTLAVWLGAIARWLEQSAHPPDTSPSRSGGRHRATVPIQVLWLTPLRALAADTLSALQEPVDDLQLLWNVERRTSDTSSSVRKRQQTKLPSCLITTPESLSLLLSQPRTQSQFKTLQMVVLDEWHELLGSKRGVQAELGLARLRGQNPDLLTWALSATIGNVEEAMETALGLPSDASRSVIVRAPSRRRTSIRSLIPHPIERFPWAGHMGMKSLPKVIEAIESAGSSLVFANTRNQVERWYSELLAARPDWAGQIALHHGSLDRKVRSWVEKQLDAGKLRCVVCTSSLDLGVDFFPVEQVLQIGSPKGVARLMQRAGRSGHYPGGKSNLLFVPTHALELIELAAAREALRRKQIEARPPRRRALDVLAQHVITIAAGGGFVPGELYREVKQTACFRDLTPTEWKWVLDFAERGGSSLQAYPEFQRIKPEGEMWMIANDATARRHRMTIGTITSGREVMVQFLNGKKLGTIEERFVSRLKPGEAFLFAGRSLELVTMKEMTAWVRRARKGRKPTAIPRWHGGRMPLSTELSEAVREKLEEAAAGIYRGPEMKAVRPLLELQARWSAIPRTGELLIERVKTRDGYHLFLFPFEGRRVHEGLATLLAWRISRREPISFATTINDYGIELLSPTEPPLEAALDDHLFSPGNLLDQIQKSMNAGELDRRQFREIARIAGLVHPGMPGRGKPVRQLQASSDMFFEVFRDYDPENLLLRQARREVLQWQLEHDRLRDALQRLSGSRIVVTEPPRPSPLAFPILIDRLRMKLSSEKIADRIARLTEQYEREADRYAATR